MYIYNQIHDIESDKANGKLYFLPQEIISINSAYIFMALVAIVSLIGAYLQGFDMGLVFTAIALTGFYILIQRQIIKAVPVKRCGQILSDAECCRFLIGWVLVTGSITLEAVLKSVPYMMAVAAVYFNTTLLDKRG